MIMGFKLIWFIAILIQYDKAHTASRRYKVRGYTEIGQNSTDRWPIFEERPCTGVDEIISSFVPTLTDGYKIIIKKELPPKTVIKVKFDSEAYVTFEDENSANLTTLKENVLKIVTQNATNNFTFFAKGGIRYLPPYLTSLKIKNVEYCNEPNVGYLVKYPVGAAQRPDVPDLFCGRRQIQHKELIVNGKETLPGAWPWHVAINRIDKRTLKYICGGTIISKHFVLTAAHCAAINGEAVLPESLGVSLGRHKLIGGDISPIEKDVYEVIIHDDFNHKTHANDIALLKLRTAIQFNEYIQPACLWFDKVKEKLPEGELFGTVTGWGFDQSDSLSTHLQEAVLPIVDDLKCIRSKPLFYSTIIDGTKFCAGFKNGTSACNGDSGGGFVVYVPYVKRDTDHPFTDGAWYVRGIVSLSVSRDDAAICDPAEYGVFTDLAAYEDWIREYVA